MINGMIINEASYFTTYNKTEDLVHVIDFNY